MMMRNFFYLLLILGVVAGNEFSDRLHAQDPFLDACEKIPFPFSDKALEDEMEDSNFSEEVPIPLDTLAQAWLDNAEGYVPNMYAQEAPDPPSVLRPRYQAAHNAAGAGVISSNSIRQVSALEEPLELAEPTTLPTSRVQPPQVPESFSEEYEALSERPLGKPYTINNNHTCDELTCGKGGCGSGGGASCSSWSLRHLSENASRKGVCDCCGLLTCSNKTLGAWFFDGWVEVGSFMNTNWPDGRTNNPLYFNDRNGEAVMNQLYLTFGRRIDPRKGRWDFGGRIDVLYGTDFFHTSALGLETRRQYVFGGNTLDPTEAVQHWNSNTGLRRSGTASLYGLSLPQAYAEVFMPFGYGVTLKAGHFYSGMGLESAMAPQNFFYSHSYSFMHGAPLTLTGATATVKLNSRLSAEVGYTEGWNVFDNPTGHISGLAGLHWKSLDKRTALSFMVHSGEDTMRGNDNRTNYTLAFQQKIGRRWQYSLEHAFGYEKNGAYVDVLTDRRGPGRWISVAQYLQWQWSETLSFGVRAEWFRDDGHTRIQKSPVSMPFRELTGKDYYEITLGANWKPTRYLTIRPEVRYDRSDVKVNGQGGAYSNFTKKEMVSFAIDGIFRF